jgi:PTH1 family peptidyl-tRNA hydrolase
MSLDSILIVGLGNPGAEYRGTWHNLGFRSVEKLAREYAVDFRPGRGEFFRADKTISGRQIILLKPTCFMNLSGQPVLKIVEEEDLFHDNILVVCDDFNLPLGKLRLRGKGSDGGHKGLASVIYYLGTENFPRLRLGIKTEEEGPDLRDYVLSEIPQKYAEEVEMMLVKSVEVIICFIQEGLNQAMTRFNKSEEQILYDENG